MSLSLSPCGHNPSHHCGGIKSHFQQLAEMNLFCYTHLRADSICVHQRFQACQTQNRFHVKYIYLSESLLSNNLKPIYELQLSFQTFSFMVLWFFFVFFKNCLRLPEDMYSVMKMTCRRKCKQISIKAVTLNTFYMNW